MVGCNQSNQLSNGLPNSRVHPGFDSQYASNAVMHAVRHCFFSVLHFNWKGKASFFILSFECKTVFNYYYHYYYYSCSTCSVTVYPHLTILWKTIFSALKFSARLQCRPSRMGCAGPVSKTIYNSAVWSSLSFDLNILVSKINAKTKWNLCFYSSWQQ